MMLTLTRGNGGGARIRPQNCCIRTDGGRETGGGHIQARRYAAPCQKLGLLVLALVLFVVLVLVPIIGVSRADAASCVSLVYNVCIHSFRRMNTIYGAKKTVRGILEAYPEGA